MSDNVILASAKAYDASGKVYARFQAVHCKDNEAKNEKPWYLMLEDQGSIHTFGFWDSPSLFGAFKGAQEAFEKEAAKLDVGFGGYVDIPW